MTNAQRVKLVRSRARVRKWEFRQRHLAHGAWHRLHLALAAAQHAYAIDDATFDMLVAEGFARDDRGSGLEPPKRIVWITSERAAALTSWLGSSYVSMRRSSDVGARAISFRNPLSHSGWIVTHAVSTQIRFGRSPVSENAPGNAMRLPHSI